MAASTGDSHYFPIYGARYRVVFPILDSDGDLVSGATGLDSELSSNQVTFTDATNEATEIATSSGMYYLDLTGTEMSSNCLAIIVKTTSLGAKTTPIILYPRRLITIRTGTAQAGAATSITLDSGASAVDDYYNGCYIVITNDTPSGVLGEARLITDYVGSTKVATVPNWGTNPSSSTNFSIGIPEPATNVTAWAGTAVDDPTTVGIPDVAVTGTPNVNVTQISGDSVAADNAELFFDGTGFAANNSTIGTVNSVASGGITAASIATGAVDADALAADAVAEIADGVWDETSSGHTAAGTFGRQFQVIRDGTAQAGAAGTITLDASASGSDDFYNGALITLVGGTGVGQSRFISDYAGSSKVATVDANWVTNPDSTSVFVILPVRSIGGGSTPPTAGAIADAVWDEARSGHTTAGTFGEGAASVQGNVTGSVGSVAAGGITASSIATDAIDADALADGAITAPTFAAGAIDAAAIAADAIGASEFSQAAADKVWSSATRSLTDKIGFALSAAGVQAIWDALTSALTTVGSIGKLLVDNINATISSRASSAEVAAVQADTDDIQSRLPAALVSGRMDSSVGAMAANVLTASALATSAVDEIVDATWDEARSGHVAAGSFGQALQLVRDGTAQAGAAGTITLDAGASASDDFYNNAIIFLIGGTGVGQARFISDYVGSTKVATINANWITNPDSTSVFLILPFGSIPGATAPTAAQNAAAVWDEARAGHVTAGSFGEGVASVQGNVTGSVGSVASGGITAASIATDAIDSDAIAASAVTEIQAGLATAAALATVQADTDDIQSRLPAALVSGRIDASVGAIAAGAITAASVATGAIDADALATDAVNEIADGLLDRNMATGADSGTETTRTVRQALRVLRNRWAIDSGGNRVIYKEDDSSTSWTSVVGTDAAAVPIVSDNPTS